MVRLYIIRHGDPDYETNRANGGTLTDQGHKEAEALAPFLSQRAKITHAYSSPLYRARLTAQLGLKDIEDFCTIEKFEKNCHVEDWSRELSSWRVKGMLQLNKSGKELALWDYPPYITRARLENVAQGGRAKQEVQTDKDGNCSNSCGNTCNGWNTMCPEHAKYYMEYDTVCKQADDFLARHGILKCKYTGCYKMSKVDMADPKKREAGIAIFCHCGLALTWLSHLLAIPLPMVHSSFWLAPSSVTTILFDEQSRERHSHLNGFSNNDDNDHVYMTPRALCVGGTEHLGMAGLKTENSYYEEWKRPSGIKHNFW